MKGYRNFIIIFAALLIVYVVAELNKPVEVDWTVTISKNDKNPYGGFILFNQLKDLFPRSAVGAYHLPVYNQLNNSIEKNTAYLILALAFEPSKDDYDEMIRYIAKGNYVLVSAENFGNRFLDSLHLKVNTRFSIRNKDSGAINFVNPLLKAKDDFTFLPFTIDKYFSKFDTSKAVVIGINDRRQADYIQMKIGKGALFIHAAPVCFSNYFMLFAANAQYPARALSYIPANVSRIYWDEYYKVKNEISQSPLAFFLRNQHLRWALRLSLAGLLIYVLFQVKRRQRVIPVTGSLKNTSLDFVKTVSNVYFNQKDNYSIAHKKISYFLDFVRQRFYLPTSETDELFIEQLARKSGVPVADVTSLFSLFSQADGNGDVSDDLLLTIDQQIDKFYKQI